MSVTLTGTGGLFTRLGKLGGLLNTVNNYRGTTTIGPAIDAVMAQYASAAQDLMDSLYSNRDSYRSVHSSFATFLQGRASATLIRMFNDDSPLVSLTTTEAIKRLITQMQGSGDTVNQSTVTVTPTAGSGNTGNFKVIASVLDTDGKLLENVFPETLVLTITNDTDNGATTRQEPFKVLGVTSLSDTLDWAWPKGSGASITDTLVSPSQSAGSNILTNSSFDSFTSNIPNNWTRVTGTAGTTIFDGGSSAALRGSSCLKITGNGAELTKLTQQFGVSAGTTGTLLPSTVYAINGFVKVDVVPAAGVLEIALCNADTDAILTDTAGTQNRITLTLSGATTSYVALNGFFRTGTSLPDNYMVRIKLTTALDNAKSVFLDEFALAAGKQLYTGGPFIKAFSAGIDPLKNDSFNLAVANTYGGFPKLFERFFGMRSLGLKLPSDGVGGETILDSLIA